ncbi:hypothetical protein Tco_1188340 [Tanacetum coccineum]
MPLFLSPESSVSCIDDLDFFKEFENEFPAIVYNDALTSKSDFSTKPTICPQHIDEFDLKDETSLSEYEEEEQNILHFNDLFPFNIIYPDGLKSDKGNDDNEIDMIQSSRGNEYTQGSNNQLEGSHDKINMEPLPPRNQRHLWLRYQVDRYTEEIVHDFEQRLETIFGRQINRVHILDFEGLTTDMRQDLAERLRMVYTSDDGQEVFVSRAWRRLFDIRAPLVHEFFLELFSTCRIGDEMRLDAAEDGFGAYCIGSERLIPDKGDLSDYRVEISSGRDFLRGSPSYTYIRDPVRRLYHRLILYSILGRGQAPEKYLFMHTEGRKSGARLSGGHFIGCLAHHFGLVSNDVLRGLSVMTREISLIDIGELVKLNICREIGDDWAWVALRPERQQDAATSAPKAAEDAHAVDEGAQADPTPIQAPQPPPLPPAASRTVP